MAIDIKKALDTAYEIEKNVEEIKLNLQTLFIELP